MVDYKELRKVMNGSGMSVKHYQNGKTAVTDSKNFKGMPLSVLEEAQAIVEDSIKADTKALADKCNIKLDSLKSVSERAEQNIGVVMDCIQSKKPVNA